MVRQHGHFQGRIKFFEMFLSNLVEVGVYGEKNFIQTFLAFHVCDNIGYADKCKKQPW